MTTRWQEELGIAAGVIILAVLICGLSKCALDYLVERKVKEVLEERK